MREIYSKLADVSIVNFRQVNDPWTGDRVFFNNSFAEQLFYCAKQYNTGIY